MKTRPVDESAARADGRQPPWPCPYPICETAAGTSAAYFQRAFGEPHHLPAAAESIADALGFCPRHGAELLQRPTLRQATARVFERVLPRVAPLLAESRFGDEQFQQVYFAAPLPAPHVPSSTAQSPGTPRAWRARSPAAAPRPAKPTRCAMRTSSCWHACSSPSCACLRWTATRTA